MENKNKYTIIIYEDGKEIVKDDCHSFVCGYIRTDGLCGTSIKGREGDCVYASALLDTRIKQVLLDEE